MAMGFPKNRAERAWYNTQGIIRLVELEFWVVENFRDFVLRGNFTINNIRQRNRGSYGMAICSYG